MNTLDELVQRLRQDRYAKVVGIDGSNIDGFRLVVRLAEAKLNMDLSYWYMADGTDGRKSSAIVEVMD